MTKHARQKSFSLWPWILLVLWIGVIWGHSLMSGEDSSNESQLVVNFVRQVAYKVYISGNPWFTNLIEQHPGILRILGDDAAISYYVRKGAHFTEYFILGVLAFNAARLTFSHPLVTALVVGAFWAFVPGIDETIQRFTPGRAGMFTDMLIDMSGFGSAVVICSVFALLGALLGLLF